jgi:hypothetical protein
MVPRQLDHWTIDELALLLEKGVFEDESFDFKEKLPDARNEKDKDRLRKTCAAFANSEGGFLVFGISDAKGAPSHKRIIGLDPGSDFPEHFGNFPKTCYPSVSWEFRNPPLATENSRLVHIVWVQKSWRAPHAVAGPEGTWSFVKRTNKGNEPMSIEEVRSAYLGFYEKRLKLQLLRAELLSAESNARGLCVSPTERSSHYSLITFDTAIVDSVLADTYSITASSASFHDAISRLRQSVRIANNKIHQFFNVVVLPLTDKPDLIKAHNTFIEPLANQIQAQCQTAISELDKLLKN